MAQSEKPELGDIDEISVTATPTLDGRPIPALIGKDFKAAAVGSVLTLSSNIPLASPFDKTFVVDAAMWLVSANPTIPGSGDAINGFVTLAQSNVKNYIAIAQIRPTEMQIKIEYKVYERRWLFFKGWKKKTFYYNYKPGGRGLPSKQQYEKGIHNAIKKLRN